jgi:hypothetical protein
MSTTFHTFPHVFAIFHSLAHNFITINPNIRNLMGESQRNAPIARKHKMCHFVVGFPYTPKQYAHAPWPFFHELRIARKRVSFRVIGAIRGFLFSPI